MEDHSVFVHVHVYIPAVLNAVGAVTQVATAALLIGLGIRLSSQLTLHALLAVSCVFEDLRVVGRNEPHYVLGCPIAQYLLLSHVAIVSDQDEVVLC